MPEGHDEQLCAAGPRHRPPRAGPRVMRALGPIGCRRSGAVRRGGPSCVRRRRRRVHHRNIRDGHDVGHHRHGVATAVDHAMLTYVYAYVYTFAHRALPSSPGCNERACLCAALQELFLFPMILIAFECTTARDLDRQLDIRFSPVL
jgi:hypothetical protein